MVLVQLRVFDVHGTKHPGSRDLTDKVKKLWVGLVFFAEFQLTYSVCILMLELS